MRRLFTISLMTSLAGPVAASPFCEGLSALETRENAEIRYQDRDPVCKASMAISGATSMHCYWVFPYRSADATQMFQDMVAEVGVCLGPDAEITQDQSVNHPDAYDLREFRLGESDFGVSIKDKGALQQTLVFLRAQQR